MIKKTDLISYAILAIPLGLIGLPLYVHLPKYYNDYLSISLAQIGFMFFITRIIDCFLDPFIGYYSDIRAGSRKIIMVISSLILSISVPLLFYLPEFVTTNSVWFFLPSLLCITYLAYSTLIINFYVIGLKLSSSYQENTIISAWREIFMGLGVILASSIPQLLMIAFDNKTAYHYFAIIFVTILLVAIVVNITRINIVESKLNHVSIKLKILFADFQLRRIFFIAFINAIPNAITATLFLFFVNDVLLEAKSSGIFLGVYFLSSLCAMPFWTFVSNNIGKKNALCLAMLMAIISFVWVYFLGQGDFWQYLIICAISGFALGGDLALLPSILADILNRKNSLGGVEFGIWNFINKFTLATAAGIALPALSWLGYNSQGQSSDYSIAAINFTYAIIPCIFKFIALILLYFSNIDNNIKRISYEKN